MNNPTADSNLVAYCGLYCGACQAHRRGKCPGCHLNEKASWCKIRSCCREHQFASCASCQTFTDPSSCKKFNNLISKLFGLIFHSNRAACIAQIKRIGIAAHAEDMATHNRQSFKK